MAVDGRKFLPQVDVPYRVRSTPFSCEDCGFLASSTGGLSLVVHNFWSILHRNPVLTLERITQDTVHGRNPKQPPGMMYKTL